MKILKVFFYVKNKDEVIKSKFNYKTNKYTQENN